MTRWFLVARTKERFSSVEVFDDPEVAKQHYQALQNYSDVDSMLVGARYLSEVLEDHSEWFDTPWVSKMPSLHWLAPNDGARRDLVP